ncbi:MAG: hypothetical protein FWF81_09745 [Defluviitaleaceae bacterium]|nr:hypothetical protein [Defluviitaleaceae bacterium]
MFEYEGLPPPCCPPCRMEREEQYQVVRELVRLYPGITALEVHDFTEVPIYLILRYIEMGLLDVINFKNNEGEIISERVGIMLKKAKEKKMLVEREKLKATGVSLDQLGGDEVELEKFTWHEE